jgi:hypothetical protein
MMLLLASLACYSGQVPGLFELTPFETIAPLPTIDGARFEVSDIVFTPQENTPLFNLTIFPEPLEQSLRNSRDMCLPNSPARVLYVGLGEDGGTYYLVECGGSAGWTASERIAGPLMFSEGNLALGLAVDNPMGMVNMLDPSTFQPMLLQQCRAGNVIQVSGLQAADADSDGQKEIYYEIECPTGNRGLVTDADLQGPLEIDADDRALAISSTDDIEGQYRLASEPGPITDENLVEGDCPSGSILRAEEIQLVEGKVYYKLACGDIVGWATQDRFVGPLMYDEGDYTVIFMAPVPTFIDELPEEALVELDAIEDETGATDDAADVEAGEEVAEGEEERRQVVQYTPPLYLAENPGPAILEGEDANVTGKCLSGSLAHILELTGADDQVYYRITCDECVEFETDADGVTTCTAYETREGWSPQSNLQGPLSFVPGERAMLADSAEDDEGQEVALIPLQPTYIVGANTRLSGRCPYAQGVEILDVVLEKDRTRNSFSIYYKVQCQGNAATYTEVIEAGDVRNEVEFNLGNEDTIIGWVAERSLAPAEEE